MPNPPVTPLSGLELFDAAALFARIIHQNQYRANGTTPYIEHPLDVMMRFTETYPDNGLMNDFYRGQAICLLHDGPEDGGTTFEDLDAAGFSGIHRELDLLTRPKDMSYLDYLLRLRASGNKLAMAVKMADLDSNMADLDNLPDPARRKWAKNKYEMARYVLTHS